MSGRVNGAAVVAHRVVALARCRELQLQLRRQLVDPRARTRDLGLPAAVGGALAHHGPRRHVDHRAGLVEHARRVAALGRLEAGVDGVREWADRGVQERGGGAGVRAGAAIVEVYERPQRLDAMAEVGEDVELRGSPASRAKRTERIPSMRPPRGSASCHRSCAGWRQPRTGRAAGLARASTAAPRSSCAPGTPARRSRRHPGRGSRRREGRAPVCRRLRVERATDRARHAGQPDLCVSHDVPVPGGVAVAGPDVGLGYQRVVAVLDLV